MKRPLPRKNAEELAEDSAEEKKSSAASRHGIGKLLQRGRRAPRLEAGRKRNKTRKKRGRSAEEPRKKTSPGTGGGIYPAWYQRSRMVALFGGAPRFRAAAFQACTGLGTRKNAEEMAEVGAEEALASLGSGIGIYGDRLLSDDAKR